MGLYEDQLARLAQTEAFLQRQKDLSDNDKRDVLDSLLNNTWGTLNNFTSDGAFVDKSETSINLMTLLRQEGIDPNNQEQVNNLFRTSDPDRFVALPDIMRIPEGARPPVKSPPTMSICNTCWDCCRDDPVPTYDLPDVPEVQTDMGDGLNLGSIALLALVAGSMM